MDYNIISGGEFFGYIGDELSANEIEAELKRIIEENGEESYYDVQIVEDSARVGNVMKPVILGKVVRSDDDYMDDREPTCYGDNIAVSGYDEDKIEYYAENEFYESDRDRYHTCILKEYDRTGMSFLKKLPFDCSTVIYDGYEQCIIAVVKNK